MRVREDIKIKEKSVDLIDVTILDASNKEVGNFQLEGSGDGKVYTIVGAQIDPEYQGKGLYRDSLLQLIKKIPNLTIVSAFRSSKAERAWSSLIKKLPSSYSVRKEKQDGEVVIYLTKN